MSVTVEISQTIYYVDTLYVTLSVVYHPQFCWLKVPKGDQLPSNGPYLSMSNLLLLLLCTGYLCSLKQTF